MGKGRNSNDNHKRDQDDVIMISDDKFAVFDFNDGDMRVESDSLKALAKFGTQTPDRKPSSRHRSDKYRHRRDKYAFLECFACGNAEEKSGSGNDTSDIEVVENLSENRSLNVGFAASRNSFDCKSPDNTFVKSHDIASCSSGVNSHAQGARNQAARTTNMIHNEILNIDSDDCGVMELRGSIPFDIPNSEGLLDDTLSSKCKMDVNDHGAVVVVNPKYVKWEDMYFTECTMAFSSICIRLEGLNICGERKSYSQEWSACAIMRIEYQHCESVKADVLKLYMKYDAADVDKSLAGTSVNAGSLQLEIVVFDDPQWAEKRERLKSLDMKYESAWEPVVNECFPIKSFDDIIYPQGDPDAVYISRRDIDFLEPRMFINDTIIDFYIKYLFNKIEPQEQHRFYFFNTFFFQKIADLRRDSSMDVVGRKAFQCVQKWTRNVDIFEKDYIFMPVNFSLHWSLIVICHPGLVANVGAKDCNHSLKFPCILHMDSIRGSHRGLENLIKSYLWEEWKIRHTTDDDCIMTKFMTLMFDDPQLPQQENLFDCGLFLLHYVELILEHAMDSTSTADLLESMDENWFLPVEISLKKRDQIRSLICRISEETAVSSSHQSKGANDGYEINDQQLSPCKQQMVPVNQFNSTNLLMEEEALEKQATSPVNIQSWSDSSSTKDIKVFMGSLQTCCRESPMMIDVPNDEDSDHEEMRVDSSASDEDLDACVVEDSEEENEKQTHIQKLHINTPREFEMGDDRVKNEAMEILGLFQLLPRLVVFDLDYTLWPFYCECRSKRDTPKLYPHARGILHALKDKGIDLAIASRSPTPDIANAFVDKLGIKSMFVAQEIFSSRTHKTDHFQRIHRKTRVPYNEMLFFDDEDRNIDAVSKMGVTSILVGNGVNLGALNQGLTSFTQNQATLKRNKQRWDKFSQKSGSSKEEEE